MHKRRDTGGSAYVEDGQGYTSKRLDHLGIVAGICRRIGLIEQIDEIVGQTERKVSVGQAVQAMVLNGLGFVSRPLYLAPEFLEGKPVEVLLDDEKLVAQDFNDDSLGRALDRLFEVGVTEIFAHVAPRALGELDIRVETVHLDSTSFSLEGDYHQSSSDEKAIKITHGYSRDRRPDLKQAVLGMICAHRGAIPVWLSALDGNSSDAGNFPGMVEAYVAQFEAQGEELPTIVADSALYSAGTLQRMKGIRWITRVPAPIAEVKTLYRTVPLERMLLIGHEEDEERYRIWPIEEVSHYGEVAQRWLLVYSEAAYRREASGLRRQIDKERAEAEKALKKLKRRTYPNREAALAVVQTLADTSWRFHTAAEVEPIRVPKYDRPGRPREDRQPDHLLWRPAGEVAEDTEAIEGALTTKGKFVLATSELERGEGGLTDEALIELYKSQNTTVERGFRFLKDPLFFASGLFLKKPERVMALLMVMGLCLLIYAACEQIVRSELARREETLPDQRGRPTSTPTMRRIFQIFEGIEVLTIEPPDGRRSRVVLNLSELHRRILELLGWHVQKCYSLKT
jgi:transposase